MCFLGGVFLSVYERSMTVPFSLRVATPFLVVSKGVQEENRNFCGSPKEKRLKRNSFWGFPQLPKGNPPLGPYLVQVPKGDGQVSESRQHPLSGVSGKSQEEASQLSI